ncbi:MAG: iron-containing alcohol dehydrogenase, partial [Halioglobus sp.]
MVSVNWSYPTSIRFGTGRIAEIAEACQAAGMSRPLVVTDRGLTDLPMVRVTLDTLESAGLGRALFSEVDPNPTEVNLQAGLST